MNKLAILSVVAILATVCYVNFAPSQVSALESQFQAFMSEHGKSYHSEDELAFRMQVFKENLEKAEEQNRLNPYATFGVTEFSDQTEEEMAQRMGNLEDNYYAFTEYFTQEAENTDTSIDWRSKMDPIQNQGSCGSCWAFAAAATLETQHNIETGELLKISEQELVDCVTTCSGCNGGLANLAYDWLSSNREPSLENNYPYHAKSESCKAHAGKDTFQVKGSGMVASGEKGMLKKLESGPISVSVDASSWHGYKSGIMTSCGQATNHAVVVSGYGEENGVSYWLIRNSWGPGWGESGYLRVKFGDNVCNITRRPSYPKLAKN